MNDGTYIFESEHDDKYAWDLYDLTDYAAKWEYGYIVGVHNVARFSDPDHAWDLVRFSMPAHTLFGVWTDPADGSVYLDLVKHVDSRRDAINLAIEKGEAAVWDLREKRAIYVGELANEEGIHV